MNKKGIKFKWLIASSKNATVLFLICCLCLHIILKIKYINIREGGTGLTAANISGQSLPTALFDLSARPAGPEWKEVQNGSLAYLAWA